MLYHAALIGKVQAPDVFPRPAGPERGNLSDHALG